MGHLFLGKRNRIMTLIEEGYPSHFITSREDVNQFSVIRIRQKANKTGSVKDLPKTDRPRIFDNHDDGINDFSLNINTQITQTVNNFVNGLITSGYITYNNFSLYRNDFAKDVKEHMKLSTKIRKYFSDSPNITQVHVLIHPNN
ncbi:1117_t:CDS:2 [Funneliformis geosporum]|nr:1117_t:CDS:2 [Funneliformis geosporum]